MPAPLEGLRVAVDVQHAYRSGIHAGDRGTQYTLESGGKVWESDCALHYAQALSSALRDLGATVWSNDPAQAMLVGPYSTRQAQAMNLGANCYLACHLNAGGGSYTLTEYDGGSTWRSWEIGLGTRIAGELKTSFPEITSPIVRELARIDRGWVCVSGFVRGPALILEPLFGDNPKHQALMSLSGLEAVGAAIARGVVTWWAFQKPQSGTSSTATVQKSLAGTAAHV